MKSLKLFLSLIIVASQGYSAWFAEFGVEMDHRAKGGFSESKNIEFGYVSPITNNIGLYQIGFGGWSHNSDAAGTKPSLYVYGGAGVEPKHSDGYINYIIAPALISSPDSYLGSHYQFFQEIGAGTKDVHETRVGIVFKHLSNAGLEKPNAGKNFITFRVQVSP